MPKANSNKHKLIRNDNNELVYEDTKWSKKSLLSDSKISKELAEKLLSLQTNINSINHELKNLKLFTTKNTKDFSEILTEISNLSFDIKNNQTKISDTELLLSDISIKTENNNENITYLLTEVSNNNLNISNLQTEILNYKTDINKLKTKSTTLEKEISSNNSGINNLQVYTRNTQEKVFVNSSNISNLQNKTYRLETFINDFSINDSSNLNNNLNDIIEGISSNDSEILTIKSDISSNNNDISNIQTDITNIQIGVSNNDSDITTLQSNVSSNNNDISNIQTDITNIQIGVSNNDSDIATLQSNVGDLQEQEINLELASLEDTAISPNLGDRTNNYVVKWNSILEKFVLGNIIFDSVTSDDISEGSTNLFYTDARVDTRLDEVGLNAIGDVSTTGINFPNNKEVIAYNTTQLKFIPTPIRNLGLKLDELTDINFPNSENRNDKKVVQWDESTNKFILGDVSLEASSSDELSEGTNNLFYKDQRVSDYIENNLVLSNIKNVDTSSKEDLSILTFNLNTQSWIASTLDATFENYIESNINLGDLANVNTSEKINRSILLYNLSSEEWTTEEFDQIDISTTTDLPEGTNLYYTDTRVSDYVISNVILGDLSNVNTLGKADQNVLVFDQDSDRWIVRSANLAINTSDDIPEGTENLYFTTQRLNDNLDTAITNVNINQLNDVDTSGIEVGNTVIWDGTSFVAGNVDQGISLSSLTDIDPNLVLQEGNILRYRSNEWVSEGLTDNLNLSNLTNITETSGYNHFLFRNTNGINDTWESKPLFTGKGSILVGTGGAGGSDFKSLPVEEDGRTIISDSTKSSGIRWANPLPPYIRIQTLSENYTISNLDHNSFIRINDNSTVTFPTDLQVGSFLYLRLDNTGTTGTFSTNGTIEGISQLSVEGQTVFAIYEGGPNQKWFIESRSINLEDLTSDDIPEGSNNPYYTNTRVRNYIETLPLDTFNNVVFTNINDDHVIIKKQGNWENILFSTLFDNVIAQKNVADLGNTPSTPTQAGQILEFDGNTYISSSLEQRIKDILGNSNLSDIGDIKNTSANDQDVLSYNGNEQKWQPAVPQQGSGGNTTASGIFDNWLFGGI